VEKVAQKIWVTSVIKKTSQNKKFAQNLATLLPHNPIEIRPQKMAFSKLKKMQVCFFMALCAS
jgi:hypothetical protein